MALSINTIAKKESRFAGKKTTTLKGSRVGSEINFENLLKAESAGILEQPEAITRIDLLLEKLDVVEEEFRNNPSLGMFVTYKDHIKKLAGEIIKKATKIHSFEDRKKKKYEVVKILDKRLNEILANLTHRSIDIVIILHTMGEIRGLILDELR